MRHDLVLPAAGIDTVHALAICAGVGGLELGLQLAHHHRGQAVRGVCYVEREVGAAASLVASMEAGWFHHAPVWSDARTFDGRPFRGCVDIVTSGDPCQGNSVAGKRRGELDDRWLLDRAIDIFDQSGAPTFFRENVPGNADGQLAVAIPALERLGCRIAVGIFSSAETGNTMRRERLFILAKRQRDGHGRRRGSGEGSGPTRASQGARDQRKRLRGIAQRESADDDGAMARAECVDVAARADAASLPRGEGSDGIARGSGERLDGAASAERWPLDETRGEERQYALSQRQEGPDGPRIAGEQLARTSGARSQGLRRDEHVSEGRKVARGSSGLSGPAILPPAVIPGPSDNRGWIDVLDRFPELQPALSEEEAQSHLRRGIDAMADRIERLRATGNGVDPVTAAYAYLRLQGLLEQ